MKTVAVLGGGPAGSIAAERLARAGLRTRIFDEKLAWEKPCGGGLTYKAYSTYPFLIDNNTPKKLITETYIAANQAGTARLHLAQPLVIYSRLDLNGMLLERAERAGAQVEQERVVGLERKGRRWCIHTRTAQDEADYCVIATGARNGLRQVGTEYGRADTMYALGYYVKAQQDHIDIQFLPDLEGYIWVFPRCGHLSVGICGKGEPAQSLRARLERYLADKGMEFKDAAFYGHVLPSLEKQSWRSNRVAGDGWVAVGDAAGLVDPITGEGLYYAVRSGDVAAGVVISDAADKAFAYRQAVQSDFMGDLEVASSLCRRLFRDQLLFQSVPARMVQLIRRSPRFGHVMQDLFAGTQHYAGLRPRLLASLGGTLQELLLSFFIQRTAWYPVPDK